MSRDVLITAVEVAAVLAKLEPSQPLNGRQVAYLGNALQLGSGGGQQGATRLFTPVDVKLMRLALRLRLVLDEAMESTATMAVARNAVLYLADELRMWFREGLRPLMVVVVEGRRARVMTRGAVERNRLERFPQVFLRDVHAGVAAAIADVVAQRGESGVFAWSRLPASAAAARVKEVTEACGTS